MRILFIIGSLREGGAEGQLLQLMRGLRARGHDVALMLLRHEGRRLQGAKDEGFEIFDAAVPRFRPLYNPAPWIRVREARERSVAHVRDFSPDVVHAHLFWAHYWGAKILAGDDTTPFVTSRLQTWRADTKPFAERVLENRVNKRADCVIANAQSVADSCLAQERNLDGKIEIIHNGIDLDEVDSSGAENLKAENARQISIVNVANAHPLKGHDDLLTAHRIVRAQRPEVKLFLCGSGTDQLPTDDNSVVLRGSMSSVIPVIKGADIAVQASRDEGMSVALLEYMACGKPVVATDVGGTREAVQDGANGLLARAGDPADLAEKILALINDREMQRRFAARARETVEKKFSSAVNVRRHEEVYRNLIERKRRQA